MSGFQNDIVRISNKLKLLLKEQEHLRKENDKLKTANTQQEEELASLKKMAAQQEERLAVMNAASGKLDDKSRLDFEKKINQYIKDIDKVIVQLNS